MRIKSSLTFLLVSAVAFSTAASTISRADNPKPEIVGPYMAQRITSPGISFVYDDFQDPRAATASFLVDWDTTSPNSNKGNFDPNSVKYCTAIDDATCSAAKTFRSAAYIPPCSTPSDNYCIDSVYAIVNGQKINGVFKSNYPAKTPKAFTGNLKYNLASGSTPSIWTIPSVKNAAGSEEYLVGTFLDQRSQRNSSGAVDPFSVNVMSLGFYAINMVAGNYPEIQPMGSGMDGVTLGGCATNDTSSCAKRVGFAENTRYGIVMRFAKPPVSWFYGRLSRALVNTEVKPYGIDLIVEGEPVNVPIAAGTSSWSNLPSYLKTFYQGDDGFGTGGAKIGNDPTQWAFTALHVADDFAALKAWMPLVNDQAVVMSPEFFLKSVPANWEGGEAKCFKDGNQVNGLVTSNATAYTPGPPSFNQQNQSLDYQMASPHLTAGGNITQGSYDLSIRSSVAECIYGFKKNLPIKAAISIVGGSSQVAAEVISNKDGWFRLGAYGFTFSQPTLRVKLTQEGAKPVTSTSNSNSNLSNSNNNNKKFTNNVLIKCKKGSSAKTFTGANPKCPAGYKEVLRTKA